MKKIYGAVLLMFLGMVLLMCTPQKLKPTRIRQLSPQEVVGYHNPMELQIAWFPYKSHSLKQVEDDKWVVEYDSNKTGAVPVILITYPESNDSIWLDMSTKSETLGKLLKHSLMTQEPITEPLGDFLEVASCSKCHPADVPVNFDY